MKIVTGPKASQFKSMRFRNYCEFSCTSVPCIPGPMKVARGREALGTRMLLAAALWKFVPAFTRVLYLSNLPDIPYSLECTLWRTFILCVRTIFLEIFLRLNLVFQSPHDGNLQPTLCSEPFWQLEWYLACWPCLRLGIRPLERP